MNYTCLLNRDCDRRTWIKTECIDARSPEAAAERYCRDMWCSGDDNWEGFEDQVPVVVRVVDAEERTHDFEVTPVIDFTFEAVELESATPVSDTGGAR